MSLWYSSFIHSGLFAAVACLSVISCSPLSEKDLLGYALRQAGDNRAELEKVLDRYSADPADSLKYEAACFLIANMPYYSYYEGEQLDHYMEYYAILGEVSRRLEPPQVAVDSIRKMYGPFSELSLVRRRDIEEVDSAYLCHNIDWAFKVWEEQPWGRNVTFDEFKEQILPYRIGDEKLSYWREDYYNAFSERLRKEFFSMKDSIDIEDPVQAAIFISQDILGLNELHFTTIAPAALPHVGPDVAWIRCGSCRELSDFVVYACRAMGIPCSIDNMPLLKNEHVGHTWVSFESKDGDLYFQEFLRGVLRVRGSRINADSKVKVYRSTFGINWQEYRKVRKYGSRILPQFRVPRYEDVTRMYAADYIRELRIPASELNDIEKTPDIVYLCGNSQFSWIPVAWTEFRRGSIVFNNIDKGDILRVAAFGDNGRMVFLTDPFYVGHDRSLTFLRTEKECQDVIVYSRTPYAMEYEYSSKMLGGVFEASNYPDFRERDTLHVIKKVPQRLYESVTVRCPGKYRYARYFGPDGSCCKIAELEFRRSKGGEVLHGRTMGTSNMCDGKPLNDFNFVFDGNTETYFTYFGVAYGGWVGMDFGRPESIGCITYTHNNMDNYVRPGDTYELYYCDDTWQSAGVMTASSDSLVFCGVPRNSLYLLKNLSRGRQAAVFTYKDGVQIWEH